eukprot:5689056-Alexandrium_andersonii.AAC.1
MSASLVGSEMCIRDSSKKRVSQPCVEGRPTCPSCMRCASLLPWRLNWICLLYTSDAADDM